MKKTFFTCLVFLIACDAKPEATTLMSGPASEQPMLSPFKSNSEEKRVLSTEYDHPLFHFIVLKVTHCDESGPFAAPPEKQLISVKVRLKNKGLKPLYLNPLAMMIQKGDERFRPTLAGCEASIKSGYLNSGEAHEGAVTFEIPRKLATPWELSFNPFIVGSPAVNAQVRIHGLSK